MANYPLPPQPLSYAAPLMEFAGLDKLGDRFFQGAEDRRQYDMRRAFAGGLPKLPNGQPDFNAATDTLARTGAIEQVPAWSGIALDRQQRGEAQGEGAPAGVPQQPRVMTPVSDLPQPPTGRTNFGAPPPKSAPQPQLSSMGTDDAGAPTIRSMATELAGGRDVSEMLTRFATAFRVKDPDTPLSPEEVAAIQPSMGRSISSLRTAQAGPPAPGSTAPMPGSTAPIVPRPVTTRAPTPEAPPVARVDVAAPTGGEMAANRLAQTLGYSDARTALADMTSQRARFAGNPHAADRLAELKANTETIRELLVKPPSFAVTKHDQFGQPVSEFVDPYAGTVTAPRQAGGPAPAPGGGADMALTGEDFLHTLDKPTADTVKAIVEGRMAQPANPRQPYWQRMLQYVAQYEPGFDLTKWGQRAATAKDFSSAGKSGRNLASFNMTMQHLERAYDAIDKLGNLETMPALNRPIQAIKGQYDKDFQKAIGEFGAAKEAAIRELVTAFRGSSGNVADIIALEKRIADTDSPVKLKAVIGEAVELLKGRIESVGDAYNRGMNTNKEPMALLSPAAQAAIQKLTQAGRPAASSPEKPPAASEADRAAVEAEMRRRGLLK